MDIGGAEGGRSFEDLRSEIVKVKDGGGSCCRIAGAANQLRVEVILGNNTSMDDNGNNEKVRTLSLYVCFMPFRSWLVVA